MFDKFITEAISEINNNEVIDESNVINEVNTEQQVHNSFVGTVIEETTTYYGLDEVNILVEEK